MPTCQFFLERIVEAMPLKRIESAYFAGDEAAQLVHYIEANYRRPVTLALIAQDTGLNRCHISRFFSRQLRQSLRTYVNALRIRDVCQALQHTDKSITEIMYECGFRHQQSFNRIFRALCGTTPGAYRSRYYTDRPNTGIQTGSLYYYRQCDAAHQYLYQPGCEPVLERITTPPAPFLSACT